MSCKIWFADNDDGYIHFKLEGDDFSNLQMLMKSFYLTFDFKSKSYICEPNILCKSILSSLYDYTDVEISNEDKELIESLNVYTESNELKKVKFPIDKELIELNPPLIGKKGFENFQLEASKKLLCRNRAELDISCRHGKTFITCMAMGTLYKMKKIDRIFIICRNEGVENFKMEILRFLPTLFNENDIAIVSSDNRNIESYFDRKIIITNYITFRLSCQYYNEKASIKSRKPIIDFSKFGTSRLIVLDEVQSINHYDSLQTHFIQIHKDFFEYRWGLSGTLGYDFSNWYSHAKFMLPIKMSISQNEWKNYVFKGKYHNEIIEDRAKEFKEQILDSILISYHDCIQQKLDYEKITYCAMNDKMLNKYREICEKYMLDIFKMGNGKAHSNDVLLKFGELSRLTSDPSLIDEKWNIKDNPKVDILKSLLEKYIDEENHKVIIWSQHPSILNKLAIILKKYNPLVIHGDESTSVKREERINELNSFKKDKDRKILLTNKTMSTSISVVECDRQIYWDLPLNSDDLDQSRERIRGPNQKNETETNFLIFEKSVDMYIWYEIIKKKKKTRDVILDKKEYTMEDFKKMLNPSKRFFVDGYKIT